MHAPGAAATTGLQDNVNEGDEVTFTVEQGKKGLNATNVKRAA